MNKRGIQMVIAALIGLQLISIYEIKRLKKDLQDMRYELSSFEVNQSNNISGLYSNIESLIKEENKIISSFDYSFGKMNKKDLTIPITIKVSPKEIADDSTVTLYVSGKETPMNREGLTFTGTVALDIFGELEAEVAIHSDGAKKIEKLEITESLIEMALPLMSVECQWNPDNVYTKHNKDLIGEYNRSGTVFGGLNKSSQYNDNNFVKSSFVVEIDGKIVSEKKIDVFDGFFMDFNEKHNLSAGETLTMAIVGMDNYGFTHKYIVDRLQLDEKAEPVNDVKMNFINSEIIMDESGKVIYSTLME